MKAASSISIVNRRIKARLSLLSGSGQVLLNGIIGMWPKPPEAEKPVADKRISRAVGATHFSFGMSTRPRIALSVGSDPVHTSVVTVSIASW